MIKSKIMTTKKRPQNHTITRMIGAENSTQDIEFTLEPEFWAALHEICRQEQSSMHAVCTAVYMTKPPGSVMDKAIRFFIVDYFRSATTEEAHAGVEHRDTIKCKKSIH